MTIGKIFCYSNGYAPWSGTEVENILCAFTLLISHVLNWSFDKELGFRSWYKAVGSDFYGQGIEFLLTHKVCNRFMFRCTLNQLTQFWQFTRINGFIEIGIQLDSLTWQDMRKQHLGRQAGWIQALFLEEGVHPAEQFLYCPCFHTIVSVNLEKRIIYTKKMDIQASRWKISCYCIFFKNQEPL